MSQLSLPQRIAYSLWDWARRRGVLTTMLGNPLIRPILEGVYNIVRPKGIVEKEIQGSVMRLNTAYRGVVNHLIHEGVYEPTETTLFLQQLRPGMTVVDIGANIGYYTLLAARAVGSTGAVHAFEPEPQNFAMLTENVRINKYNHVTLQHAAVSDSIGTLTVYFDEHVRVKSSLSRKNLETETSIKSVDVPAMRLDDYLQQQGIENVDVLKVDVEGAEALVLAGAERVLQQPHLKIFMEFWAEGLKNMNADPRQLLEGLVQRGFRLHRVDETHGSVQPITIDEALSSGERWNSLIVNLFLEK